MLSLEELGATGNKGLIGLISNPVIANAVAGLATSATAQAAVQRMLLWQRRDEIVEPFGETAQQVFARVSAYRDSMDGPMVRLSFLTPRSEPQHAAGEASDGVCAQIHDQGIVNTDPRFIAVPLFGVNIIPTVRAS